VVSLNNELSRVSIKFVRRIFTPAFLFALTACSHSGRDKASYWESRKGQFRYVDRDAFQEDSALYTEMAALRKHPFPDSLFHGNPVYLYAWQTRRDSLIAFTVVEDRSLHEHGTGIYSMLYDRSGRLISNVPVASKSGEGGVVFETAGRRLGPDTMLLIRAVTDFYDYRKKALSGNGIGDTVFSYLVMTPGRLFSEVIFKKIRNLPEEEQ
jgi:hypothetical protein